jgi:hypothetical protein
LEIFTGLNDGVGVEDHKDRATDDVRATTNIAAYIELQEGNVLYFQLSINMKVFDIS